MLAWGALEHVEPYEWPHEFVVCKSDICQNWGIAVLRKEIHSDLLHKNCPKGTSSWLLWGISQIRWFSDFQCVLPIVIVCMSLDFEIFFDLFWRSPYLVQSTANSFTKASRMDASRSQPLMGNFLRMNFYNDCLWISTYFLVISMDFMWNCTWMSFDFPDFARWFRYDCQFCIASCGDRRLTKQNP